MTTWCHVLFFMQPFKVPWSHLYMWIANVDEQRVKNYTSVNVKAHRCCYHSTDSWCVVLVVFKRPLT